MKGSLWLMPCSRSSESRVRLDGLAQLLQGVVQARPDGANGRPHGIGGLARGEAEVVDQHDHRPVLDAEPPERLVELEPGRDARGRIGTGSSSDSSSRTLRDDVVRVAPRHDRR